MSAGKEQQKPMAENWLDIRSPAMAGINTIVDVHDIKDQEAPDMLNMYFDMGVIGNRPGYSKYASKPLSETGTPMQIILAKTSDGVVYLLSVYASGTATNNFYLYDTVNLRWIIINGLFAPTFSVIKHFGAQDWNYAYGDDRLYLGNGYDDTARWRIALGYLSINASSSDSNITLTDASRFNVYSATISSVNGDGTTVSLNASTQASAVYTNEWERGQMVYYIGGGIVGLTSNTIYYAVPSAYALPTNGVSGNTLGFAATLSDSIHNVTISISGSPSSCTIYKAEPVVFYDGLTFTQAIYFNKTGNVLNLTTATNASIGAGSSICSTLTDRPAVPKGNILTTWKSRFVVGNCQAASVTMPYPVITGLNQNYVFPPGTPIVPSQNTQQGSGNTMWISRISSPEDYVTNQDDISSGGFQIFNDGAGGITDIKDFGEFLLISKSNIIYRFDLVQNQDLSAQFSQLVPLISGIGMGPQGIRSSLKALNTIYYPSTSSGFIALSPVTTGTNSSSGLQVISFNINNIVPNYDFTQSRAAFYKNKLFWTATSTTSQNIVFMYDTVRAAWTKFDDWNPVDFAITNDNTFFFLSSVDGNIYKAFSGYTDNNNPYNSYFYTKLNTMGKASVVKTLDNIYVEGYMTQSTTLYADVLYNEKGRLFKTTYKMTFGVSGFTFTNVFIGGLGQIPFNQNILDSLTPDQLQNFGYFRCYLAVPLAYGLFALQIKFYTKDANNVWFLTGYGMNPQYEPNLPPSMQVSPVNPINISF